VDAFTGVRVRPLAGALASRPASHSRTGSVRSLVATAISRMRTGDCVPPDGGPVLKAVVTARRGSVRSPFVRQAVRLDGRPGPGCGTHTAPASRCALNRPHLSKAPNPGSSTRDTASGRRCKRTPPGDPQRPTTPAPTGCTRSLVWLGRFQVAPEVVPTSAVQGDCP